jgi:hypothetical protein
MRLAFTSRPMDKIAVDLLVLMHFEGEIPFHGLLGLLDWRVNGRLSRFVQAKGFVGKAKEALLLPSEGRVKAKDVILLGLGCRENFNEAYVSQVLDHILDRVVKKKAIRVCLSLNQLLPSHFEWRNAVRLFLSKLFDYPAIEEVVLCENEECLKEAKRRQMDFGQGVQVLFN